MGRDHRNSARQSRPVPPTRRSSSPQRNRQWRQAARCDHSSQEDYSMTAEDALRALIIRHTRPTPEELAEVDRRNAARLAALYPNSLGAWDAGDDPGVIPPRQWLLGNQF